MGVVNLFDTTGLAAVWKLTAWRYSKSLGRFGTANHRGDLCRAKVQQEEAMKEEAAKWKVDNEVRSSLDSSSS